MNTYFSELVLVFYIQPVWVEGDEAQTCTTILKVIYKLQKKEGRKERKEEKREKGKEKGRV